MTKQKQYLAAQVTDLRTGDQSRVGLFPKLWVEDGFGPVAPEVGDVVAIGVISYRVEGVYSVSCLRESRIMAECGLEVVNA